MRTFAIAFLVLAASACSRAAAPPSTSGAPAAAPVEAAKPASEAIDAELQAAIGGPARTDKERARDVYRHPAETLAFFGLRDDATVIELWPGSGYYTTLLAPVLASHGQLVITHFDPNGDPKSYDTRESKFILDRMGEHPDVYAKVKRQQIARPDFSFGPDGSADFVLTFRNVHNWIEEGSADKVFAAAARVLKSGGVLGLEEHRGNPGMTEQQIKDTGYVPEDVVVHLAEQAGFKLAARSDVNANPKDDHDHPNGVWSLPPSFAGKDVDRDKFAAIGESDRMTLKFVKP